MRRFPWHTFLAALVPIVSMYAVLPGAAAGEEIVRSTVVACAAAGGLLLLLQVAYRDLRKAALLATIAIVVFVSFGGLYAMVETVQFGSLRPFRRAIVLPAIYLGVAAIGWVIARARRPLVQATAVLNIVAAGCLVVPLYSVVRAQADALRRDTPALALPAATTTTARPDIYYIVFDRYGDESTLRQHGFDNQPFYRFLESRGFYVARDSRSNYVKTALSLASSLNMSYLDPLQQAEGRESQNWLPVFRWIRDGSVVRFLKSQGYRYVHVGSWYGPTESNPGADRNVNFYTTVPYPTMRLLHNELLAPLRRLGRFPAIDERVQQWYRVPRQIADVIEHAADPGPTFSFIHILVPHPPYVFDRDGGYLSEDVASRRGLSTNYVNQVVAANAMATRLIDGIVQRARTPPVIILQGDEGPYPRGTTSSQYNWHTASASALREKSGILNAYLLPGRGAAGLYPSVSPVNSFRVVLNAYFGTGLPLLPDRIFAHESELAPYSFADLTSTLGAPRRAATAGAAPADPATSAVRPTSAN